MWLRWSWRDLRRRWVQVAAIALVLALGTGTFAGLTSLTRWRIASNDASLELTQMWDLRAELPLGTEVPQGSLHAALEQLDHPEWIALAGERLVLPTLVDASDADPTGQRAILVSGRLIGVELGEPGGAVAGAFAMEGRSLEATDAGTDTVLLEHNFALHYDLPPAGSVRLTGGREVAYVGQALAPEYFLVVTDELSFFAQASFAAVFTSLETAQRLGGAPGAVNDLVLTLAPGADVEALAAELEAALADVGATILVPGDDVAYRTLTEDPEGDQQLYNVFAAAIFAGAVFAAFNLTSRMVEAQRREIGIAMALGLRPRSIAVRPLLVGAQIAVLGVLFGLVVGIAIARAMGAVLESFLPLPVYETPFQPVIFGSAALAGLLVPLLAIAWPVWRAVHVDPVDAIKTGHLASRGGGLAPLVRRLPLPPGSLARMPVRNLVRAPRRALLTVLGVAAVIAVLVSVVGMLDSFIDVIDRSEAEVVGERPERVRVDLDRLYPLDGPEVGAVLGAESLSEIEPALALGGTLLGASADDDFGVAVDLVDYASPLWRPTVTDGALDPEARGLLIARKAATDLGVDVGDTVTLRHAVRSGPGSFVLAESTLPVLGIHAHPSRNVAYMDYRHAELFGLDGRANRLFGVPATTDGVEAIQRALFGSPGVAAVQPVTLSTDLIRDLMEQFTSILQIVEGAALLLALLIAFNAASISGDERQRENATMLAFGVPVRSVMRVQVLESFAIGVLGSALGLGGGYLLLRWIVDSLWPRVQPDLGVQVVLSPAGLALVLALGVLVVAAAPLLTVRRLRGMDIPSTLRVME